MALPGAIALAHLALIDLAEGRLDVATEKYLQTLDAAIAGESDEWAFKSAGSIGVAARRRDPEGAARLLAACAKHVAELGYQPDPPFAQEFERTLDELRSAVGEDRLEELLEEGRTLSADETIARALLRVVERAASITSQSPPHGLSYSDIHARLRACLSTFVNRARPLDALDVAPTEVVNAADRGLASE